MAGKPVMAAAAMVAAVMASAMTAAAMTAAAAAAAAMAVAVKSAVAVAGEGGRSGGNLPDLGLLPPKGL